jgi:hypothetical protein
MERYLRLAVLPLIAVAAFLVLLVPSSAVADAPPGPYFNGFETNTSSWFDTSNGGDGSSRVSNLATQTEPAAMRTESALRRAAGMLG